MEATGRPLARLSFAATLVATLLLAACSSGTASNSGAQTAKPIKIGISLSRSGDFSDPATQVERGYQLWADHVNAKGGLLGRKVQLVVVDDASSPTQVVTNYQNLISPRQGRPCVRAVLEPAHDPVRPGRRTLWLRFPRAGGRRSQGVRGQAAEPVLCPAGPGGVQRRGVRQVGPVAARRRAAEDGRLPVVGRPVRVPDG